ncbi:MAG: sulfite exporter TauE/SafE family protein [Sphingobacteriaceae bacterium]
MHILGYIAAIGIGLSLGLVGGGGSILTVPVLVYLFGIDPTVATAYSLVIISATTSVGAFKNYQKQLVSFPVAFSFGLSSMITVFLIRKLILPAIPTTLFNIGSVIIHKSEATMLVFALLMLVAAYFMIKTKPTVQQVDEVSSSVAKLLLYGIGAGLITGFLGAGGGFVLIPALVLLVHLPMKKAVGTSLLIIALNSLVGIAGDWGHVTLDWVFAASLIALALLGLFIGVLLSASLPDTLLKKYFGWFVCCMGIVVLSSELYSLLLK